MRCEDHIGAGREFQSASKTKPLNCGDNREWQSFKLIEDVHIILECCPEFGPAAARPRQDVATETEVGPACTQQYGSCVAARDLNYGRSQFGDHLIIDSVLRSVVERDRRNVMLDGAG